jgi:hypothetical protein
MAQQQQTATAAGKKKGKLDLADLECGSSDNDLPQP